MAKYKLKSLSVQIRGIVHRKEEKTVFDTKGKFESCKEEVEAAFNAGFLELVKGSKKDQDNDSEFPEDMPYLEVLVENGITTFDGLNEVDDLTKLKGIGKKSAGDILEWLEENEK